jgi:hypothetical protein
MKSVYVSLDTMEKVQSFVNDINMVEGSAVFADYCSIIDAKSILGIFSRDLTAPLKLEIIDWNEDYRTFLQKYIVKEN